MSKTNEKKCQMQRNNFQQKGNKEPYHRWTEEEILQLINYLKEKPIEKPSSSIYYTHFIDDHNHISLTNVQNKVLEFRRSFEKATNLQNAMKTSEIFGEDESDNERILLNICPYFEQLKDVFEKTQEMQLNNQKNSEDEREQNCFENIFFKSEISFEETNMSVENNECIISEESNAFNDTAAASTQFQQNPIPHSIFQSFLTDTEPNPNSHHHSFDRSAYQAGNPTELSLKEREMRLKERDQILRNEMFQFKKQKYLKKMQLKRTKMENDHKIKILKLEINERLSTNELNVKEGNQIPKGSLHASSIDNIPDLNQILAQFNSIETRLQDIEDEQRKQRELIEQTLLSQSKMFGVVTKRKYNNYKCPPHPHPTTLFPIRTDDDLKNVNKLAMENMSDIVAKIQMLINPGGLHANFDRLFDPKMAANYNYDGVRDKKSLKEAKSLMTAIFEAVKTEGTTEKEVIEEIKLSIKVLKNRYFKRQFDERKRNLSALSKVNIKSII